MASDRERIAEHDAFHRLTEGAQMAIDGALLMSRLRPDQRNQWEKVAEAWTVTKEACYRLAGESVNKQ